MNVTALKPRNAVESLRGVVQDLLVPELKAVKVSIEAMRSETTLSMDNLRNEMRLRDRLSFAKGSPHLKHYLPSRPPSCGQSAKIDQ